MRLMTRLPELLKKSRHPISGKEGRLRILQGHYMTGTLVFQCRPGGLIEKTFLKGLTDFVRDSLRVYWALRRQLNKFQVVELTDTLCKLNKTQASTLTGLNCIRPKIDRKCSSRDTATSVTIPIQFRRLSRERTVSDCSTYCWNSRDNASSLPVTETVN